MVTWTIRNGGWPRYVSTNLASLYRLVFGITDLKGMKYNDFKFIPNKAPEEITTAVADDTQPLNRYCNCACMYRCRYWSCDCKTSCMYRCRYCACKVRHAEASHFACKHEQALPPSMQVREEEYG
jgi:hypothetical protein